MRQKQLEIERERTGRGVKSWVLEAMMRERERVLVEVDYMSILGRKLEIMLGVAFEKLEWYCGVKLKRVM